MTPIVNMLLMIVRDYHLYISDFVFGVIFTRNHVLRSFYYNISMLLQLQRYLHMMSLTFFGPPYTFSNLI